MRSHEDSHLNSSSGRPSEHPVPRHADFDTKRQHYAAQLEKEIQQGAPDGFALLADKEGIPQDTGSEASSRAKPGNKDSSGLPRISAEMQSRSSFREDLDQVLYLLYEIRALLAIALHLHLCGGTITTLAYQY